MGDIKYYEINNKGQAFEARDGKWVMRSDVTQLIEESKLLSHNNERVQCLCYWAYDSCGNWRIQFYNDKCPVHKNDKHSDTKPVS